MIISAPLGTLASRRAPGGHAVGHAIGEKHLPDRRRQPVQNRVSVIDRRQDRAHDESGQESPLRGAVTENQLKNRWR